MDILCALTVILLHCYILDVPEFWVFGPPYKKRALNIYTYIDVVWVLVLLIRSEELLALQETLTVLMNSSYFSVVS